VDLRVLVVKMAPVRRVGFVAPLGFASRLDPNCQRMGEETSRGLAPHYRKTGPPLSHDFGGRPEILPDRRDQALGPRTAEDRRSMVSVGSAMRELPQKARTTRDDREPAVSPGLSFCDNAPDATLLRARALIR
jgi:hypothetical protein